MRRKHKDNGENRNPALCRAFTSKAQEAFAHYPQIEHSWSIDADEDHCILDIPKKTDCGFPITAEVFPDEIVIIAEGAHSHLEISDDVDVLVESALGLIRDLLSPTMRVRELCSNGRAFRWYLESLSDGQWRTEEVTGLFFFPFFGKKTQNIYQNNTLPSRY